MTGFNSKRDAAADKLQEPIYKITVFDNAHPKGIPLEDWVQPVSFPCCGYTVKWNQGVVQCHMCGQVYTASPAAQPVQEPVARVSGTYGGKFVYDPINRATILPIGMALYSSPQREWVGLTDAEVRTTIDSIGQYVGCYEEIVARKIETKLKEKNS